MTRSPSPLEQPDTDQCAALSVSHSWAPSRFSIRPLILVDEKYVEDAVDEPAQFWGLYFRNRYGLLDWLSDHATKADAMWHKMMKEIHE